MNTADPGFGVVAMAAYRPDAELFRTQLESIRDQTHRAWRCLISVDGDPDPVRQVVDSLGDERFEVLGFDDRLGFFGNFERVLTAVGPQAGWVALSDQDDKWYPTKLATLLPHLAEHSLVCGQARVVSADTGKVLAASTNRKNVPLADLVIQNQVTGGQTVFRRELLDLALPFPRFSTITETHDHWLAVCAAATDSVLIADEVVQDYVQHGANVLGEVSGGFDPGRSVRRMVSLADRFAGGHSPARLVRATRDLSYGWRRAMVSALARRVPDPEPEFRRVVAAFGDRPRWAPTIRALAGGFRRGNVAASCLAEFVAGTPGEVVDRVRNRGR